MTIQTKEEKAGFLFETVDQFLDDKIQLIFGELKPGSNLTKNAIGNILLEIYNRSSTQTKVIYPCPACRNLETDCMICDLLLSEIESYK